jgi:hypothetical protein
VTYFSEYDNEPQGFVQGEVFSVSSEAVNFP